MHSTTCSAILDTSTSSLAPQWKPKSPQKQTFISIRGLFTPGVTLFYWADTLNLLLQSHIIFSENKVAALATYTYVSLIAHLQTAFITNAWCQPKHRIKWLNEWELNAIKKGKLFSCAKNEFLNVRARFRAGQSTQLLTQCHFFEVKRVKGVESGQ